MKKLFTILLGLGTYIGTTQAQTTITLTPSKDNSIYSENNNNSDGRGQLFSGLNCQNNSRRALMQFDLSSIPSNATITNVSLTLNVNNISFYASSDPYTLHALTTEWGEGTSDGNGGGGGAAAVAPDATWSDAMLGTSTWTTAGGDFASTISATHTFAATTGTETFSSTAGLVADVQNWVDNPTQNHGWILIGDENNACTARRMGSKDNGTAPSLEVTYTTGCTNTTDTITPGACGTYTSPSGAVYNTSGSYLDTIPNAAGCDSIITIHLTILNFTAEASGTDTLTANIPGSSYQWIDCSDSSVIVGATNQTFLPTASGSYAVIISGGICTDTSNCVSFVLSMDNPNLITEMVQVYPNPTTGLLNIDMGGLSNTSVQVFNTVGQLVFEQQNINDVIYTMELPKNAGLYTIKVIADEQEANFKVIKE